MPADRSFVFPQCFKSGGQTVLRFRWVYPHMPLKRTLLRSWNGIFDVVHRRTACGGVDVFLLLCDLVATEILNYWAVNAVASTSLVTCNIHEKFGCVASVFWKLWNDIRRLDLINCVRLLSSTLYREKWVWWRMEPTNRFVERNHTCVRWCQTSGTIIWAWADENVVVSWAEDYYAVYFDTRKLKTTLFRFAHERKYRDLHTCGLSRRIQDCTTIRSWCWFHCSFATIDDDTPESFLHRQFVYWYLSGWLLFDLSSATYAAAYCLTTCHSITPLLSVRLCIHRWIAYYLTWWHCRHLQWKLINYAGVITSQPFIWLCRWFFNRNRSSLIMSSVVLDMQENVV